MDEFREIQDLARDLAAKNATNYEFLAYMAGFGKGLTLQTATLDAFKAYLAATAMHYNK